MEHNFTPILFHIRGTKDKDNDSPTLPDLASVNYYDNFHNLNTIKSKIDAISDKDWDYFKKKSNPFECVTTNGGLANYNPISRAYFKMLEIVSLFKDRFTTFSEPFTTLHLAEGPGGFMECINNVLSDMNIKNYNMYGMTLMKEEKCVPSWKKTSYFLDYNKHVHVLFGKYGTGDLYNIYNI
jgi:hypothetical protein